MELPMQDTAELFRVTQPEMSAKSVMHLPHSDMQSTMTEVPTNERTRQNIETGLCKKLQTKVQ